MVMGNAFREDDTLIYDHVHRRSTDSEGRNDLRKVCARSPSPIRTEIHANSSWGRFANVVLYFVHEDNFENKQQGHYFRKVLLFATHSQRMFYEPEGGKLAVRQDRVLEAAVLIADATISLQADYYQSQRWRECVPSVNKFALYSGSKMFGVCLFEDLPKAGQEPQASTVAPQPSQCGGWYEIFNMHPHSNAEIRTMLDPAIREAEVADQEPSTIWRDPGDLPPAILTWLKGQKQILFFTADLSTANAILQQLWIVARNLLQNSTVKISRATSEDKACMRY